jgi:hypothetical protein
MLTNKLVSLTGEIKRLKSYLDTTISKAFSHTWITKQKPSNLELFLSTTIHDFLVQKQIFGSNIASTRDHLLLFFDIRNNDNNGNYAWQAIALRKDVQLSFHYTAPRKFPVTVTTLNKAPLIGTKIQMHSFINGDTSRAHRLLNIRKYLIPELRPTVATYDVSLKTAPKEPPIVQVMIKFEDKSQLYIQLEQEALIASMVSFKRKVLYVPLTLDEEISSKNLTGLSFLTIE